MVEFTNLNVDFMSQLERVIALDKHSIAYNADCLYVWGRSTGQLGIRSETAENLKVPHVVILTNSKILLLEACNKALVFYAANKFLYIFSESKMKYYKAPK